MVDFFFKEDSYHEVQKYSQNSLQHPDTAEVSDRVQPRLLSNVRMSTFLETIFCSLLDVKYLINQEAGKQRKQSDWGMGRYEDVVPAFLLPTLCASGR